MQPPSTKMKISKCPTAACPPYQASPKPQLKLPSSELFREPGNSRSRKGARVEGKLEARRERSGRSPTASTPSAFKFAGAAWRNDEKPAYICIPHISVARAARTGDVRACSPRQKARERVSLLVSRKSGRRKMKKKRKRKGGKEEEPVDPDNNNQNE